MKNRNITIGIIIFSIICGIISKDYYLGIPLLMCGLLNCYYASIGKIVNYIFGALYCLLSGYVCYKNGLYGIAFLSLLLYFPSQILGYFIWSKFKDDNVKIRKFNIKNSIIIVSSCILGSIVFGFLLTKIPNQQLAFLDSSSNIISICGITLMNLRFRECWMVWLAGNTFDLLIWIINVINKSENSLIMLIVSFGYLIINIYGLIMWNKKSKVHSGKKKLKMS